MAITLSRDFTVNRDDIIESALKIIGVYDAGEAVPAAETTDAAQRLNLIVKEWTTEGIAMSVRTKNVLFLNKGKQQYRLGNVGTTGTQDNMHWCTVESYNENTLTSAAVTTATTLEVANTTWKDYEENAERSTVLPDDTDNILLRLTDGNMYFDTISGTPSATTITLADVGGAGLNSGASAGAKVYTYPAANRQTRPAKILYAYRSDTGGSDSQLDIVGRIEYERLSQKTSSGPPTKIHYSPTVGGFSSGESSGELFVWPVKNPSNVDKIILICEHTINDFDGATDNIPLPIEYGNGLIWGLASELSYEYGVDRDLRREIKAIAEDKKDTILNGYDVENASFQMSREMTGR